jgi:hypothetical protein
VEHNWLLISSARHIRIFTSQILSAYMKKNGPGGDRAVRALSRAWGNADKADSKVELQAQLHHSWIMHARDRTKRARTKRRAQSVEIGVVEGVEHFTAKLQARGLPRKLDAFGQRALRGAGAAPVGCSEEEINATAARNS